MVLIAVSFSLSLFLHLVIINKSKADPIVLHGTVHYTPRSSQTLRRSELIFKVFLVAVNILLHTRKQSEIPKPGGWGDTWPCAGSVHVCRWRAAVHELSHHF